MLRRLVPAILTFVACQQSPAPTFESNADNLARGSIDSAANARSAAAAPEEVAAFQHPRGTPRPPLLPRLGITATATLSPAGATMQTQIDFVTIGVDFVNATRGEVAVEFISPGASPYERLTAQLTGAPTDTQHVDFVLPVAGTWIESQAMTGTWYAHVFYKGTERLTQPFDLTP